VVCCGRGGRFGLECSRYMWRVGAQTGVHMGMSGVCGVAVVDGFAQCAPCSPVVSVSVVVWAERGCVVCVVSMWRLWCVGRCPRTAASQQNLHRKGLEQGPCPGIMTGAWPNQGKEIAFGFWYQASLRFVSHRTCSPAVSVSFFSFSAISTCRRSPYRMNSST